MSERVYTVNETFDVLNQYKITSNIESVRRWLRDGTIAGIALKSRKEGWKVTQTALDAFLAERLPDSFNQLLNATNDAKESAPHTFESNATIDALEADAVRAAMWRELVSKNIWEGYVPIKKLALKAAAEHRGYSQALVNIAWERCVANSAAYKQPRVSYLLEAFSFEGQRLLMDQSFASKEEQVIYAIFDYVKKGR